MRIWQWRVSAARSTIFQFFALFYTTTKSHETYVFLYPFSNMAISPQNNEKNVFYTGKLYGLTGMLPVGLTCSEAHEFKR